MPVLRIVTRTELDGGLVNLEEVRRSLRRDLDSLRAPQGYLFAGSPRYRTLFGRDSLIAAWETLAIDPSIAKATLRILAHYQGRRVHAPSEEEPGRILHEHRFDAESRKELPDWDFPYFGSIDSTPLFVIVAAEYERSTGDRRLVDELWPAIEAACRWMTEYGDKDGDGYLEYNRTNPYGLLHQSWKDGIEDHLRMKPPIAMIEVQGYAVAARRAFAALAANRGHHDAAEYPAASAIRLREALNRDFWMVDRQFYALALDGSKQQRKAITSNPGHLLLMGAVPATRMRSLVARMFCEDMWTPYGIRAHASSEPDFDPYSAHNGSIWPHDNWIFARGLLGHGFLEDAKRVTGSLLRAYQAMGRIPERYVVDGEALVDVSAWSEKEWRANPLQAWSTGALLDLLSDPRLVPP